GFRERPDMSERRYGVRRSRTSSRGRSSRWLALSEQGRSAQDQQGEGLPDRVLAEQRAPADQVAEQVDGRLFSRCRLYRVEQVAEVSLKPPPEEVPGEHEPFHDQAVRPVVHAALLERAR